MVCTVPFGQRTVISSTTVADPRPNSSGKLFCEPRPAPPLTSCTMDPAEVVTTTRAPTALALDTVPFSRNPSQWFPLALSFRQSRFGSPASAVITRSRSPSLSKSAKAAPRPSNAPPPIESEASVNAPSRLFRNNTLGPVEESNPFVTTKSCQPSRSTSPALPLMPQPRNRHHRPVRPR